MNYMIKYHVKGYELLCVRTFISLDSAIRFLKHNDQITSASLYKIILNPIDYDKFI